MRRAVLRASLVALALVGSFAAVEVALRIARPVAFLAPVEHVRRGEARMLLHRPSAIPGLAYELVPSSTVVMGPHTISVDALGLRGPEVDAVAPPGVVRVLAMGDSVTFGWDLDVQDTWPARLDEHLNADADSVTPARRQVSNAGVSGYGTRDEVLALDQRITQLAPDVVVLAYFLNDPEQLPLAPLRRYFVEPAWWQHSHVLRLAAQARYDSDVRHYGGGDVYRYLHAPDGPCWPRELEALDQLATLARSRAPRTLVVVFPAYPASDTWSAYPWADVHARVADACRTRGLAVLDLLPAFASSGLSPRTVSIDTEHPGPLGNDVAARAIAAELERRGWLDPSRARVSYVPR